MMTAEQHCSRQVAEAPQGSESLPCSWTEGWPIKDMALAVLRRGLGS